jgi:hypothetical protein
MQRIKQGSNHSPQNDSDGDHDQEVFGFTGLNINDDYGGG